MNLEQKLLWILDPEHDYKTEGSDMHDFAETTVQVRRFHKFACEVSETVLFNGHPRISYFSLYFDVDAIFGDDIPAGPEDYQTITLGKLADLITHNNTGSMGRLAYYLLLKNELNLREGDIPKLEIPYAAAALEELGRDLRTGKYQFEDPLSDIEIQELKSGGVK